MRVVREDPANRDVLYCGTETGAYVTLDRGKRWLRPGGKSLPTAPVYDLVIHPRERDLIVATHGRSLWILDDAACFAGLTPAAAAAPLTLFPVRPVTPRLVGDRGYGVDTLTTGPSTSRACFSSPWDPALSPDLPADRRGLRFLPVLRVDFLHFLEGRDVLGVPGQDGMELFLGLLPQAVFQEDLRLGEKLLMKSSSTSSWTGRPRIS